MIERANEVVNTYLEEKLAEYMARVQCLGDSHCNVEEVKELLGEANSYIKMVCGQNEDLYDDYRYRLFFHGDKFTIVQGKEVNCEPSGTI